MKSAIDNKFALLILDIIIILLCVAGLYQNYLKPSLPFSLITSNNNLTVTNIDKNVTGISTGDLVLSIDDYSFSNWEEVELYLDGKKIGDEVNLNLQSDISYKTFTAALTNYYSLFDLSIIGIIGLFFIVFAILVRVKAPDVSSAKIFHIASLGLGMVIMMTAGNYISAPYGYGYINRIFWLIAYSFTPVLFIHFTLSFVKAKNKNLRRILWFMYMTAGLNAIVLSYFFINTTLGSDIRSNRDYVLYFDSFFRLFFISCVIVAIAICIYAYRQAIDREERKRLQWLLLGFFIGPFSFVLFWVLPILFIGHSLVPEALVLIFLTAIPITFSIAIIKYHLMDINLLVRRSVVYTIILAFIIIIYVGISSIITLFISDINPAFPSVLTALAVVALLQPVKASIQKFVDKKFFRVEYDYREEQRRFLDDIKNIYYIQTLAELIVSRTDKLIPVEKMGFFELSNQTGRVKIIASKGWELLKGRSIPFKSENLKTDMSLPVAVDDKVEPGLKIESADVKVFKRWGMVLVFPVKSPTAKIHGFLVLGAKKSGVRFLKDDIDLLNAVVIAAALAIDRIKLQEELILEHLEAERLKELDEMRKEFINTMTHDLKTPLTNIKLFTQMTEINIESTSPKAKENLRIIDGESDKLKRMIDNILDYAIIEKGMKSYELKSVSLTELVKKTVNSMKYQFMISKQTFEVIANSDEIIINADEEAIERAITNLITNAIKYSSGESKTTVTVKKVNSSAGVEVRDNGNGISNGDLKKIFEPFKRVKSVETKKIEGTGLGLAIVKHIMDAHNGRIEVESEIGKGSKFTLWFSLADE